MGQAQFVVFDILTSAYYLKLQEKSCYYLLLMYVKKRHRGKKDEILKAYTLLVICTGVTILHSSRYNFALVLQDALVFSQSKASNFFMYIIVKEIFHAFSIFSPNLT